MGVFKKFMTQIEARKLILKALYQDDWLYNQLVLKAGNALAMIYGIGSRTTLDLDFSIQGAFSDLKKVENRIKDSLLRTFKEQKIVVFDFSFTAKPKVSKENWWGGYRAEFKLISENLAKELEYNIEHLRRQSFPIDPGSQKRKYTIEISKFEYIEGYQIAKYEGMDILVYSPLLLAVEKLRALLQQHPGYTQISAGTKRSRARDLYDIWIICDYFAIDLSAHLEVVRAVFDAKKVNMDLLWELESVKALHEGSWADVELSVSGEIENFEFYFDYVNNFAKKLHAQWKENSP